MYKTLGSSPSTNDGHQESSMNVGTLIGVPLLENKNRTQEALNSTMHAPDSEC